MWAADALFLCGSLASCFQYPSLIRRLLFPLEFRAEVNHEETSHGAIRYPPVRTA